MTSSADEEVDIADWLCAIHLEKYQNSFRQHGYHTVKDILSVDNEVLQQIGVGATGHRKRIITRLRNISGDSNAFSPSNSMEKAESFEYSSKDEKDLSTTTKNYTDGKVTYTEPVAKPVPKPRTVFNKSTATTSKEFAAAMMSTPTNAATSPAYPEHNSVIAKKASPVQETTVPRGSSLDSENCNSCMGLKPGGVEMEAGPSRYTSAGAGKPFHPIPSLPMRQNKETSQTGSSYQQYKLQMEADTIHCSTLSILPSFAGSKEEVTSFSTSPPSPQETLTMISNEIYSGFGPTTDSVSCATDMKAPQIYLNPPDMIKQETTPAPERVKSPQMRNSTVKPVPMRNSPSPTPGSIRDGACPRPAPVGISASPTTSRLRTTAPGRPLPVGNQSQLLANQKRITAPITFSTASLRPNPVGDSGSPRLPRTGQITFPRPTPIGHSASPMLPRVKSSPSQRTDSLQNDDLSISPPLTTPSSSRQGKKKQSTVRQEVTGNTSLHRQKSVTKNTVRPVPIVRKSSSGSPPGVNDILHRPNPVGNAGSSNIPSTSAPSQKSFLLRYTTPLRPTGQKPVLATQSGPCKPVQYAQLHIAEPEPVKSTVPPTILMSKRPTPMGISPSSTLKKPVTKKPVPNTPAPKPTVSNLPKLKPKESKVPDLNASHLGTYETIAVPKAKKDGLVPRTKSIVSLATQKVKAARNDSSLRPMEAEHCSTERTKVKGSKFLLKQKPAEKYGLSIQKSAGSVTFQRPKQTGNSGSQPPKCKNVVSSTKNSQPSSALPRPPGNAEVTKPSINTGISLSKVIKNIPSARPKQKDVTVNNMTRPQPVGNISTSVSKSKSTLSLNHGKTSEGIVRTSPKKITSNLLPRLPFIQKKSSPKMSLLKTSPSRAGENSYLVCSPGRITAQSVSEEEESDMVPPSVVSSSFDESLDLHKTYRDSWDVDLTEESLEAALRASANTFNPIQDEHLVLVRPRLLGSHLSDAFLEQKYRISKANDG